MPSAPPPIPSAAIAESFHHTAATYAVLVIPAGLVLNLFLSPIANSVISPPLKLLISALPALLMLSALPAGVIALFGIPKHGKRKLLWKGLVGVLIPVLLIALAIPAFLKVKQMSEERARQAQENPK